MSKSAKYDSRLEQYEAAALHVGISKEYLAQAEREGRAPLPEFWAWASDGDSWLEWGEKPKDDEAGIHFVILSLHPYEMTDVLHGYAPILVPLPEGYHVVHSDPHDWSVQGESFTLDEAYQPMADYDDW